MSALSFKRRVGLRNRKQEPVRSSIFIYLAASGLRWITQDLSLRHMDSLVVAHGPSNCGPRA